MREGDGDVGDSDVMPLISCDPQAYSWQAGLAGRTGRQAGLAGNIRRPIMLPNCAANRVAERAAEMARNRRPNVSLENPGPPADLAA